MNEIHIYKLNLNDFNINFCSVISPSIVNYCNRYKSLHKVKECLASHWLRRFVLKRYVDIKYKDMIFDVTDKGRPFLKYCSNYDFNISHSYNYIVMAVVYRQRVGVDIELFVNSIDALAIAKRYYSNEEYAWLSNLPKNCALRYFYVMWTLKESILKWTGDGILSKLSYYSFVYKNSKLYLFNNIKHKKPYYFSAIDDKMILSFATTEPIICAKYFNVTNNVVIPSPVLKKII